MPGSNQPRTCSVVLMNGSHWFFSLRVCTCGGDASPWRLCVLTAVLRSWCMSLEVFSAMKARVKLVLCCVQLSCPNITREMVSRKDWFSATVSSFHPYPACFSYLLHLVVTLCCNGLCWVGFVFGFGQNIVKARSSIIWQLKKITCWKRTQVFNHTASMAQILSKGDNFSFSWREMFRCMCLHVYVHVFIRENAFAFHISCICYSKQLRVSTQWD